MTEPKPTGSKEERWAFRPSPTDKRLMERVLKQRVGVTKTVIIRECLHAGLRKYAQKKDTLLT